MTYSIGIDIGGTNTDLGLVRSDGVCVKRCNLPTNKYSDAGLYIADMVDAIIGLMDSHSVEAIDGVGIGAPNANFYTGCIDDTPNLKFRGVTKMSELMNRALIQKKHLDVPVVLSNDANAAAYGEYIYGGARGMQHFIMFTLGTGVGSGIVVDGRLVHGSTGGAGELGHAILIPEGRQCNCGRKGCLEMYCSARGICCTAVELMEQNPKMKTALADIARDTLSSKDIGEWAKKGDALAIKTLEKTGYYLGIAMANAVTFSAPQAIFLMGGPVKAGDFLLNPLRESFKQHLLFTFKDKVEIKLSELSDNDVAILGAAALSKAKF